MHAFNWLILIISDENDILNPLQNAFGFFSRHNSAHKKAFPHQTFCSELYIVPMVFASIKSTLTYNIIFMKNTLIYCGIDCGEMRKSRRLSPVDICHCSPYMYAVQTGRGRNCFVSWSNAAALA